MRKAHPTRTARTIVLAALAIAVLGGLAVAGVWALRPSPSRTPPPEGALDATSAVTSRPVDATPPTSTPAPEPTTFTPMSASEWDAFVARQYPDYRVRARIRVPDQFEKGLPGMNYVLSYERQRRFTLLVCLAQLGSGQSLEDAPDVYVHVVGRIATNDSLFSADAKRGTEYLAQEAQDAIISGYLRKQPSASAVAFGGFGDEGTTTFMVAIGPSAIARALKSREAADYIVETTIPSGPRNTNVTVTVSRF